jgi:sulfite exporter TauE/SafE
LGKLGRALSPSGWGLGLLTLAVAVVMLLLGTRLTGLSPRLGSATLTLPTFLARRWTRDSPTRPYHDLRAATLGLASFFLPCGFTQAAQVAAAASGSAAHGALVLGLFTLGTTPGLMAVGTLSSLAQGAWASRVFRYIGVAVLAFAAFNAVHGLRLVDPGLFAGSTPITATVRTANVTDEAGVQVVRLQVDGAGYTPRETVVYADQPIRWEFTLSGLTCAQTVDGSRLGFGRLSLQQGLNTVTSTLDVGRHPYSCAMGMFASSIVAIEPPPNG